MRGKNSNVAQHAKVSKNVSVSACQRLVSVSDLNVSFTSLHFQPTTNRHNAQRYRQTDNSRAKPIILRAAVRSATIAVFQYLIKNNCDKRT